MTTIDKNQTRYSWLYRAMSVAALVGFMAQAQAQTGMNLGVGLQFGSGNMYGAGGYGGGGSLGFGNPYGSPYGYGGYGTGYYPGYPTGGMGGYMGGLGATYPNGMIPPVVSPCLPVMQQPMGTPWGWGQGFNSYPYNGYVQNGTCGVVCGSGLVQQPVYPVNGGPVVASQQGGGVTGSALNSSSTIATNGLQVIDLRRPTALEIEASQPTNVGAVFATGMTMTGLASQLHPMVMNQQPIQIGSPTYYQTGVREFDFYERPHSAGF